MDIRWTVGISYSDNRNTRLFTSYTVNASSKSLAENIGRELFTLERGLCNIINVIVEPERLTLPDMSSVLSIRDKLINELNADFINKSYKDFVLSFYHFEGFNAKLTPYEDSYFWFRFLGAKIKAVFKLNGECYIDTDMVFYKTSSGSRILVRNNWTEFYYCS